LLDIEDRLTLDERSAVDFVLSLRKRWSDTVYPAMVEEFAATGAAAPTSVTEAEGPLHQLALYPWFSHLERVQQKMSWRNAADAVIARREELVEQFSESTGPGQLQLDADVELPDWYTDYDIHVQPGGVFSDDLSAYVYEFGARIVMLRDNDGYKFHTLFATTALPEIPDATRVLDMGCGFGKSTRPLKLRYPSAEVIGVDLAAPGLRLAHAESAEEGLDVTYRQADARSSGVDAGSCDVVTGTMVLHEMPEAVIKETIEEAARLAKPGGTVAFLEFQPTGDPFRDATIYEHAERNNEPFFRDLFGADLVAMCTEAGLENAHWTPFDERSMGISPSGWGQRREWHFPWAVLTATRPEA
jgi:ubiquinone/menaquinone biosynthesis C-methylase UbiE